MNLLPLAASASTANLFVDLSVVVINSTLEVVLFTSTIRPMTPLPDITGIFFLTPALDP